SQAASLKPIAYRQTPRHRSAKPKAPRLLFVLAFLVTVLHREFVYNEVGGGGAVQLDAVAVVPLNHAVDLLAVTQDNHHWGLTLHLFLVIEILSVGAFRRRNLLPAGWAVGALGPVAAFHGRRYMVVIVLGTAE